jgi:hypothetical protein
MRIKSYESPNKLKSHQTTQTDGAGESATGEWLLTTTPRSYKQKVPGGLTGYGKYPRSWSTKQRPNPIWTGLRTRSQEHYTLKYNVHRNTTLAKKSCEGGCKSNPHTNHVLSIHLQTELTAPHISRTHPINPNKRWIKQEERDQPSEERSAAHSPSTTNHKHNHSH